MRFGYTPIAYGSLPAASTRTGDMLKCASASQGGTSQPYWVRSNGANWVSMGPIFTGTWANKPSASDCPVWSEAIFTNLGNNKYYTNGTVWVPLNGRAHIFCPSTVAMTDTVGTTETIVAQFQMPAAFLAVDQFLQFQYTQTKASPVTAAGTTGRIYIGTAGTTSDTVLNDWALTGAQDGFGCRETYLIGSATSWRPMGNGNANDDNRYDGAATNSPTTVTMSNISNSLYITVTLQWGTTPVSGDTTSLREFSVHHVTKI